MSCNGCRILRKGCNENCILRESLQGIESPQAQANAAVFVAKFFGRAGLISFLSSVPKSQRPAMLQSLLYEACGRTVNPVNGAVGLLSTGNWHLCQAAVDTVFRGGVIAPMVPPPIIEEHEEEASNLHLSNITPAHHQQQHHLQQQQQHGVNVMSHFPARMTSRGKAKRRAESPEEESGTTSTGNCFEYNCPSGHETPVLRFFL